MVPRKAGPGVGSSPACAGSSLFIIPGQSPVSTVTASGIQTDNQAGSIGRNDPRFRPLVSRSGLNGHYVVSEHRDTGALLVEISPNLIGSTNDLAARNLVRDLLSLRPSSEGPYDLMFHPNERLNPTAHARREWAEYLKGANVRHLALLNYDSLGRALRVVAQLLVVAAGRRETTRFFHDVDGALEWFDSRAEAGEPVYPYVESP